MTTKELLRLRTIGFKTIFSKSYNETKTFYQDYVTEVDSTGASEVYGWFGEIANLREWIDEKMPKKLRENGFTLVNKDYETTLEVDRNDFKDDKLGQINARVRSMGIAARKSYDRLLTTLIESGTTTVCYDGQYFFDTDHSEGDSGTQSNLFTSSALSVANAKTIIAAMTTYKDDQGNVVGINPTHIMVPGVLEWTAKSIFGKAALMTTTPADGVLAERLEVVVNPYLTVDGTPANSAYYIMDLSQPIKPFILQKREDLKFVALDQDTDEAAFWRKKYYYSVEGRFVFGFGDWRMCARGKG